MSRRFGLLAAALLGIHGLAGRSRAAAPPTAFHEQGLALYQAGRYSDAIELFEQAIKRRDHAKESQAYIERIRKETVDRIRNRALTGVNKSSWQTKYYYMVIADGRVRVGISAQEVFERESLNFRPGALDALYQLSQALQKANNTRVDIDLINEINQETATNPELVAQQLTALFSYLSLASRDVLPKY